MGKYIKGLFKDNAPKDQPEGTWRYAKNMTMHPMDGALTVESGILPLPTGRKGAAAPTGSASFASFIYDIPPSELPPYSIVIGAIEIEDNRVILLIAYDWEIINKLWASPVLNTPSFGDGSPWDDTTIPTILWDEFMQGGGIFNGEIGEFDGREYTRLYRPEILNNILPEGDLSTDTDINFNVNNFAELTYKKNPDGDLFVYWTDDLNPPRVLNITRQKRWLREGLLTTGPNVNTNVQEGIRTKYLYGIDYTTTPNPRHKDMLNLFPASGPVPDIQLDDVHQGGGLLTGVYYLALAYVDQDLVQTNYLIIANPVSIVEDTEGVLPIERYDGAPPKMPSGKAISWAVSNINTDYEYVRPAVIRKADGAAQAFKLNDIPTQNLVIPGTPPNVFQNNTIVFTGLEGFEEFSVEDVIVDTISYDTAKTINQLDGVLYLGNVKGSKDLGYQRYANHIKLRAEIGPNTGGVTGFNPFDPHEITEDVLDNNYIATDPYGWNLGVNPINNGYRWNENIFKFKGYTRDEVYAFYIAFILNDGTESYAYHIPGRAPLQITPARALQIPAWNADNSLFLGNGSQFESGDILNPGLLQTSDTQGRIFHFYETSMMVAGGAVTNNMNYWQNRNEFYPSDVLNRSNWETWSAVSEQAVFDSPTQSIAYNGEVGSELAGQRVRHHHFPSNENNTAFNGIDNTGFQIFGGMGTANLAVGASQRMWFALDFTGCTSRIRQLSGVYRDVDRMMDEAGITATDISNVTGGAQGNIASWTQSWVNTLGYSPGLGIGSYLGQLIAFEGAAMPEQAGFLWPDIGEIVNYAFIDGGWDSGINEERRFAGSYHPSMYSDSGGLMNTPGGLNNSMYPGNWGGCWGTGDLYVQGGGKYGNLHNDQGGPDGAQGCDALLDTFLIPNDGGGSVYWPTGCVKTTGNFSNNFNSLAYSVWTAGSEPGTIDVAAANRAGCGGPDSTPCFSANGPNGASVCDQGLQPTVVWSNDSGTDNMLILVNSNDGSGAQTGQLAVPPFTGPFDTDNCAAFVWFDRNRWTVNGPVLHNVRALGFSLYDLEVPQDIWDKTQGFRIYYAHRDHDDRRILGQNIVNPYVPTLNPTYPQCISAGSLGIEDAAQTGLYMGEGRYKENWWVNLPYSAPPTAYESKFAPRGDTFQEYQAFSFHDFYLMRTRNNITAATHFKVEYGVEMMPWAGPGITNDCYSTGTPGEFTWGGGDSYDPNGDQTSFADPSTLASNIGQQDCWTQCLVSSACTIGFHVGIRHWNASQLATLNDPGTTGGVSLYTHLLNFDPTTGSTGDLNRPLKERSKSYVDGDSVFNGKQLGFGYKVFNEFGESHIAFALHERYGILPAWQNTPQDVVTQPVGLVHNVGANTPVMYNGNSIAVNNGIRKNMQYQGNLHAFRQDMFNSIDTQDLVWTGFQIIGDAYIGFKATTKANESIISGVTMSSVADKYDTLSVFAFFNDPVKLADPTVSQEFKDRANIVNYLGEDGKIFGGDTFIARHGWRKTLRPNVDINSGAFYEHIAHFMGRDMRFVYETIVESTDNINFRHVENKNNLYWPGSTVRDILEAENLTDFTDVDNIAYNDDYSAVNDLGHTVPLPLQIAQPSDFPTRVIRSTQSDDSSLVDSYRVFLANQFKDLSKTRGELWKISVFNNLLYFHMEDSILRTKGKQTMQLADASEAFVGSGDIFAQAPDELVQTDAGYGGTQSQYATVVTTYGYFCLNQKERQVYMIGDQVTNISSIGMEKWFQANIPFAIEAYQADVPTDNPYTFGFHSVWDQRYQRILLTKRELVPTRIFRQMFAAGNIYYNTAEQIFYYRKDIDGEWFPMSYTYFPQSPEGGETWYTETENSMPLDWSNYDQVTGPYGNPFQVGSSCWAEVGGANFNINTMQTTAGPNNLGYTLTLVENAVPPNTYLLSGYTSTGSYWQWTINGDSSLEGCSTCYAPDCDVADIYIPSTEPVTGFTFFEPSGWTISYNPELNIWISFHDDISYKYTNIGENLYSFGDFPYLNPVNFMWDPQTSGQISSIPRLFGNIYRHHSDAIGLNSGGAGFYNIIPEGWQCGTRYERRYTNEIEVIHNEDPETNKIFTNFSFNTDVFKQGFDQLVQQSEDLNAFSYLNSDTGELDNIYNYTDTRTRIFSPGFDSFVVWNSHQASGEIDFKYFGSDNPNYVPFGGVVPPQTGWSTIGNIRKNGADWSVNKFRDIVRDGANTSMASVLGSQTTGIPQVYFGLTDNNTSTNPIEFEEEGGPAITGRDMWIHSGMSEFLNPLILNVNNPRRKFVDKWIALRLICRNKNNIVNLLSTKVGTRKYHRHE